MRGAIPPLHQYVFMAWCLAKHRDNFSFVCLLSVTVTQQGCCSAIRGPFESFVDWLWCAAVMQRESVTYAKL
jgi:hypothetical protein